MSYFRKRNVEILSSGEEDSLIDARDSQQYHTPYQWEKQLIRYIRDGNLAMVRQLFERAERTGTRVGKMSENQLRQAQYHAVILSYQISRAAIEGGMYEAEAFQRSDAFIQRIDRANTVEEILKMNMEEIEKWTQAIHAVRHRRNLQPAIRNCQEYIHQNLHNKIKLDDLARICGLSTPYLSSLFKEEVGKTISAYILELKIKTAQELLVDSKRSSKNIAFLLNFSSQSYFIRCFKRVTGLTPREYRNKHAGLNDDIH